MLIKPGEEKRSWYQDANKLFGFFVVVFFPKDVPLRPLPYIFCTNCASAGSRFLGAYINYESSMILSQLGFPVESILN